jgi:microcystin-dependent protein
VSEAYIGEIRMMGFNFAPKNWALCNGQSLAISQNAALFSILGTTYGGDGRTTFNLPNLQGRAPIHWGNGNGLPPVTLGQAAGTETHTITVQEAGDHIHDLIAATAPDGSVIGPNNAYLGVNAQPQYVTGNPTGPMAPETIKASAGGQPHSNMQPYQVVNFCICTAGIFPSRN